MTTFNEHKHRRGQPGNAGQFAAKPEGTATQTAKDAATQAAAADLPRGPARMVADGFHERDGILHFQVKVETAGDAGRAEAVRCIDEIGRYNAFDADVVGPAVNDVLAARPGVIRSVSVGREYSPVLYAHAGWGGSRQERAEALTEFAEAMRDCGADEVHFEVEDGPNSRSYALGSLPGDVEVSSVRAWWD